MANGKECIFPSRRPSKKVEGIEPILKHRRRWMKLRSNNKLPPPGVNLLFTHGHYCPVNEGIFACNRLMCLSSRTIFCGVDLNCV